MIEVLVVLVLILLWILKTVVIPGLSITASPDVVAPNTSLSLGGTLTGPDTVGKTVSVIANPPSGDPYIVGDFQTDLGGVYSHVWTIPVDAVEGEYILEAQVFGSLTATTTFTGTPQYSGVI